MEQLIDYDIWATDRLLHAIEQLSADILEATTPGVYGTVLETMSHVVGAERSYVARLSGLASPGELADLDFPGLRREARTLHAALRALAPRLPDPSTISPRRLGPVTAATVLTQLVQHGCEHRGQVATILGAHGLEAPRLDGWAHGRVLAGLPPLA